MCSLQAHYLIRHGCILNCNFYSLLILPNKIARKSINSFIQYSKLTTMYMISSWWLVQKHIEINLFHSSVPLLCPFLGKVVVLCVTDTYVSVFTCPLRILHLLLQSLYCYSLWWVWVQTLQQMLLCSSLFPSNFLPLARYCYSVLCLKAISHC